MTVTLEEFIIKIADSGIKLQKENGSMPPGHNGPYKEKETPVRNTAHWLQIFSFAYKSTKKDNFENAVKLSADYLCSNESWPNKASFYCRATKDKYADHSNGVMGAAWVFEALLEASIVLNETKYKDIAESVFLKHKFDEKNGLWHRLEINNNIERIDQTFNHQLWFASASSNQFNFNNINKKVDKQLWLFMDRLQKNITVMDDGLIYHPILYKADLKSKLNSIFIYSKLIFEVIFEKKKIHYQKISYYQNMVWKSIGYQSFNTYALSVLKKNMPMHAFWKSNEFERIAKSISDSSRYLKALDAENYYGYAYNLSGFEIAASLDMVDNLDKDKYLDLVQDNIQRQLDVSFNIDTFKMDKNTYDSETATARIYALTKIPIDIAKKITIKI